MNDKLPTPAPNPVCALRADLDLLSGALSVWADRDDAEADPQVTQAGHDAAAALDRLIAGAVELGGRLTDDLRKRHEAAEARWRDQHPRWRDTGSGPGWPAGDESEANQ